MLSECIYEHLDNQKLLLEEQKGCRKNVSRTHDLLYIDNVVLNEVKCRKKHLTIVKNDSRKAIDVIAHTWLSQRLNTFSITDFIRIIIGFSIKK